MSAVQFRLHDEIADTREPDTAMRIVWISPDSLLLGVIDLGNPHSMPRTLIREQAAQRIENKRWTLVPGEAPPFKFDTNLLLNARKRRDDNWAIVNFVIEEAGCGICDRLERTAAIEKAARTLLVGRGGGPGRNPTTRTVKTLLRLYFHGRLSIDALLPAWDQCGAPGKERASGDRKRGRPAEFPHGKGLNVTPAMRRTFMLAIDLFYARNRKMTFAGAYKEMLRKFFMDGVMENGKKVHRFKPEYREREAWPTYGQFHYWVSKEADLIAALQKRQSLRKWEQRHRPLLGTTVANTSGPCGRFEIDATMLDIYVRSRRGGKVVVGRPTLYCVVDVWSRMIVGIYVGLEPPSWTAAMMALANCLADKVTFCASYGVEIDEGQWLSRHVGNIILGDGAETKGTPIEPTLLKFNIRGENATAWRGDFKAVVETRFCTLQVKMRPFLDGWVEPDFRDRGAEDYRRKAVLDLDDVTRVIISLVLYYNNSHQLAGYPMSPAMIEDEVAAIPAELHAWGVENLTGAPRAVNADEFRMAMLPTGRAKLTRNGIAFRKRFYGSRDDFERWKLWPPRPGRAGRLDVSFDPRLVDTLYVHRPDQPMGCFAVQLNDHSASYVGLTHVEADVYAVERERIATERRMSQLEAEAGLSADLAAINSAARDRVEAIPNPPSPAKLVAGIRPAREQELEGDRLAEAAAYAPKHPLAPPPPAKTAGAAQTMPPVPADVTGLPSLRQRMNAMRGQNA